jgi:hypothetical protein
VIKPYRKPPPVPPVALVRRDGAIVREDGSTMGLLGGYPDDPTVIYADKDVAEDHVLHGRGSIIRWNDTWCRWEVGGRTGKRSVILLPGFPGDDETVLAGLIGWRDWLRDAGATIGTIGSASMSLFRASLDRPLYLNGGEPPVLPEVVGGRQEQGVPPGYYGPFVAWDMAAAYTRALGGLLYQGGVWARTASLPADGEPWPTFAHARVSVDPGASWGPLPRRLRKPEPTGITRKMHQREYPAGRFQGIWSGAELRAAERAGARVTIDRAWIMAGRERYPFARWLSLVEAGRRLPGYAGRLAKITGNALWGRFIFYGDRTRLSYESGAMVVTDEPIPGRNPNAAPDLAELITSTVRARVLDDLLTPYGAYVWSVHTDGGLVDAACTPALPADWRAKDRGRLLIYIGPQAYAWSEGRGLRYKLAGTPPDQVVDTFANLRSTVLDTDDLPQVAANLLGRDPHLARRSKVRNR